MVFFLSDQTKKGIPYGTKKITKIHSQCQLYQDN